MKIKDFCGLFLSDLNFRFHPHPAQAGGLAGIAGNEPQDYPGLTPEAYINFYKALNVDTVWVWIKHQSGHVTFSSRLAPRMRHFSADFFKDCCRLARQAGMYVIGYTCGGDDYAAYQEHPEWFAEYGAAFACLNAPFWEREFGIIREALRIFPCDGLFCDMVRFSGRCRCGFCQKAYREFFGRAMPKPPGAEEPPAAERLNQKALARFRHATFERWVKGLTQAAREIVPAIEICANQQWYRPSGIPLDLLKHFDWYYSEFDDYRWVGEILRAWGDKPLFSGNTVEPRYVAHLMGRRIMPIAYGTFTDHRTGRFVSAKDPRLAPVAECFAAVRQRKPYVRDTVAIPHAAVLFSIANEWPNPPAAGRPEGAYPLFAAIWLREITRMGLTCLKVENVEQMQPGALSPYEIVFAPELAWCAPEILARLKAWVKKGGILVVAGNFALKNKAGALLDDFADQGLLGVRKAEGPLPTFSVLTGLLAGKAALKMRANVPLSDAIVCRPAGAEPAAEGSVGADNHVPLIWRHKVGAGVVFYISGSVGLKEGTVAAGALRQGLRKLLSPYIRQAPFQTTIAYPAEVWLNKQPDEKRLVLHIIAFEKALVNQAISIRADLIAGGKMELVYPAGRKTIVKGRRQGGYFRFALPRLHKHVIFTLN